MQDVKLTVLDPRGQPSGLFGRHGEPGSHMMAIFDPKIQPVISIGDLAPRRLAPRLGTLENKTKYLVNTGFAGGETNPIWQSTDYVHYATAPCDKWIPEDGIKLDEKLLRMPSGLKCADGSCGIM